MYQPPMGRPMSSPPDDLPDVHSTNDRRENRGRRKIVLPYEVIGRIRADYQNGLSMRDISAKYGYKDAVLVRYIEDLRYVPDRLPGETSNIYAGRVMSWRVKNDPAFRRRYKKKLGAAMKASWKKRNAKKLKEEARAARAEQKRTVEELQPAPPMLQPAPQPTFWQRIVGWFR